MPNFMKIERGPDFFLLIWYGMTRIQHADCYFLCVVDSNRSTAIMSLKDKEKCIQEMWQKERIFDDLLALILPGMVFLLEFYTCYLQKKNTTLTCIMGYA